MKFLFVLPFIIISSCAWGNSLPTIEKSSIYNIESSWTNQDSKTVTLKTFQGKPVVLAMVYTSCQSACPLLIADMQKIERMLSSKDKSKVTFVLVSFDSDKDTPKELYHFAKSHSFDLSRWSLLSSTPDAVRELAAALNVQYIKNEDGSFSHSDIITILDEQGKIVFQQMGLGQDTKIAFKKLSELTSVKK